MYGLSVFAFEDAHYVLMLHLAQVLLLVLEVRQAELILRQMSFELFERWVEHCVRDFPRSLQSN